MYESIVAGRDESNIIDERQRYVSSTLTSKGEGSTPLLEGRPVGPDTPRDLEGWILAQAMPERLYQRRHRCNQRRPEAFVVSKPCRV